MKLLYSDLLVSHDHIEKHSHLIKDSSLNQIPQYHEIEN